MSQDHLRCQVVLNECLGLIITQKLSPLLRIFGMDFVKRPASWSTEDHRCRAGRQTRQRHFICNRVTMMVRLPCEFRYCLSDSHLVSKKLTESCVCVCEPSLFLVQRTSLLVNDQRQQMARKALYHPDFNRWHRYLGVLHQFIHERSFKQRCEV